jgi:hypothetical protein
MTMYRSAIVNELNEFVAWKSDFTKEELYKILVEHPEWSIELIEVEG